MPLDLKAFRDHSAIKKIKKSVKLRGLNIDDVEEILKLEQESRSCITLFEKASASVNKLRKNISSTIKISGQLPQDLVIEMQNLENEKNLISSKRCLIDKQLEFKLNTIGNILDETYFTEEVIENNRKKPETIYFRIDSPLKILLKQKLLGQALSYLVQNEFEIFQIPFFIKSPLFNKVFKPKPLTIQAKKHKTIISNICQPLLLMHYKETIKTTIRSAGYGFCFKKNKIQQEKIGQIIICNKKDCKNNFENAIQTAKSFYNNFSIAFDVVKRSPNELSISSSIGYDFFTKDSIIKLFSCKSHTDYYSKPLKLKCVDSSTPYIITTEFCNLNTLSNLIKLQ
jgi:seryl-tRNA synthetase